MRKQMLAAVLGAVMMAAGPVAAFDIKVLDESVFESLSAKAKEKTNITLDGSLIHMGAAFLSDDDDDKAVKKMLMGLKSVHVRNFEFSEKGAYSETDLKAIRRELNVSKWTRIVAVEKSGGESTEIFIMQGRDHPEGLLIISAEPKELSVVQIIGAVDLSQLGALKDFGVKDSDIDAARQKDKK